MKPLLPEDALTITTQETNNFGAPGGIGEKLQTMLENKASKEVNWVNILNIFLHV